MTCPVLFFDPCQLAYGAWDATVAWLLAGHWLWFIAGAVYGAWLKWPGVFALLSLGLALLFRRQDRIAAGGTDDIWPDPDRIEKPAPVPRKRKTLVDVIRELRGR